MDSYFSMYVCSPYSYVAGRINEFGNSIYGMRFGDIHDDKVCITGRHQESCHLLVLKIWMFCPTAVFSLKWGPSLGPLIPKFWASLYPCLSSDLFCRVFQPGNLLEFGTSFSCRCWHLWRCCLGRLHGRLSIIQRLVDFAFLNFCLSSSLNGSLTTHLVLYAGCWELLWVACPLSLISGSSRRGTSTLNLVWH